MSFENPLEKYVSDKRVVEYITSFVNSLKNLSLIIRNPRNSFFGNMIYSKKCNTYKIYINKNLSPSFFLYVFLHEYAHTLTHLRYTDKVKPHGKEWQYNFLNLLQDASNKGLFEENIKNEIQKQLLHAHIYSNTRDRYIKSMMDKIDLGKKESFLSDIPLQSTVLLSNNMTVKIEKKIRTRYLCSDVNSDNKYLVSGVMTVKEVIR